MYCIICKIYLMLCTWNVVHTISGKNKKYEPSNFKPRFDKNHSPLTLKVDENTAAGFILADISTYVIDDEKDLLKFTIDSLGQDICTIGEDDGKLRLKVQPDREKKSNYKFHILASDNFEGGINREAVLEVFLYIRDQNDNKPVFQNTPYHAHIPEDIVVGAEVITVHAIDADTGRNKDIRYTFKDGSDSDAFSLNPNSGVITVTKTLDYEKRQRYIFEVVAKDEGTPALTEMTEIVVNVIDIGDTRPHFVVHTSEKFIQENLPRGTIIAVVSAKDGDESINNEINYSITGGDEYGLFFINKRAGHVTVNDDLDRESYQEFELQITAYEVNQPESTADITFKIHLLDENDNKPKFHQYNYFFRITEENVNAGTIISDTIKANDEDATAVNSILIYGMSYGSEENKYFQIQPDTGVLVLKSDVKSTIQKTFNFLVYATERDTKEHYTATANVTVTFVTTPSMIARTSEAIMSNTPHYLLLSWLVLLHSI